MNTLHSNLSAQLGSSEVPVNNTFRSLKAVSLRYGDAYSLSVSPMIWNWWKDLMPATKLKQQTHGFVQLAWDFWKALLKNTHKVYLKGERDISCDNFKTWLPAENQSYLQIGFRLSEHNCTGIPMNLLMTLVTKEIMATSLWNNKREAKIIENIWCWSWNVRSTTYVMGLRLSSSVTFLRNYENLSQSSQTWKKFSHLTVTHLVLQFLERA